VRCTKCKRTKVEDGYKQCEKCRAYVAAKMRRLRAREPDRMVDYQRDWRRKQRQSVLAHYGGRCACCGETEYEFLSIDHIEGGGTQHRRDIGSRGATMMRWLINNGYPEGFRVLCHNCNQAIGFYGKCPHEATVLRVIDGGD
jgi:hypothetical protein